MFYFPPEEVPAWIDIEKHKTTLPLHLYISNHHEQRNLRKTHITLFLEIQ